MIIDHATAMARKRKAKAWAVMETSTAPLNARVKAAVEILTVEWRLSAQHAVKTGCGAEHPAWPDYAAATLTSPWKTRRFGLDVVAILCQRYPPRPLAGLETNSWIWVPSDPARPPPDRRFE